MDAPGTVWIENSSASDAYGRQARLVGWIVLGAAVFCFGTAAWCFAVGLGTSLGALGRVVFLITSVGLVGIGVYALVGFRQIRRTGLSTLGVSRNALILKWERDGDQTLAWDDRGFALVIQDNRPGNPNQYGGAPCQLTVGRRWAGLSAEGCDAILAAARRHSLSVSSKVRTYISGSSTTTYRVTGPR